MFGQCLAPATNLWIRLRPHSAKYTLEEPYHTYISIGHSSTRDVAGHIITFLEVQDRRLSGLSAVAVKGERELPIYLLTISCMEIRPFFRGRAPQDDGSHLESIARIDRSIVLNTILVFSVSHMRNTSPWIFRDTTPLSFLEISIGRSLPSRPLIPLVELNDSTECLIRCQLWLTRKHFQSFAALLLMSTA